MGRIDAHSCGAVWANVQNEHGAPGICTRSGDSLLKYYRATGDRRALDLLTNIAHGLPQYIARADQLIGLLKPGEVCERVNLSAWEDQQNVGAQIFGSSAWIEAAALMAFTELPGICVRPDTGLAVAFDTVWIENLTDEGRALKFRLANPTKFPADVTMLVENARAAKQRVRSFVLKPLPMVCLDVGASTKLEYSASSISKK